MELNAVLRSALSVMVLLPIATTTAQTITITAAPATTTDFMSQLLSAAKSLLDSVYPQISSFSTVTLPATVVIEGSTYRIPDIIFPTPTATSSSSSSGTSNTPSSSTPTLAPSTSTPSSLPAQTSASIDHAPSSSATPHGSSGDKHLGIILGVVLGFVALALLAALLFCLRRRKRRTGSYIRDTKPPPEDAEIATWKHEGRRPSWLGKSAEGGIGPWREDDSYAKLNGDREARLPPIAESGTSSDSLAAAAPPGAHEDAALMTAADGPYDRAAGAGRRRSMSSSRERRLSMSSNHDRPIEPVPDPYQGRPQTPLVHDAFGAPQRVNSIPRKPVAAMQRGGAEDPFASPEDEMGPTTPMVPVRSPERWSGRSSGPVYPSGSEVEGFDFGLGGRRREWDYTPRRW